MQGRPGPSACHACGHVATGGRHIVAGGRWPEPKGTELLLSDLPVPYGSDMTWDRDVGSSGTGWVY